MANKTLVGKINLAVGTYDMVLPTQVNTPLPNALANSALEEVYIVCDSTLGAITINLPEISLFNGSWNAKIYVTDVAAVPTSITVLSFAPETINGAASVVIIATLGTKYLHITSDNNWMCLSN